MSSRAFLPYIYSDKFIINSSIEVHLRLYIRKKWLLEQRIPSWTSSWPLSFKKMLSGTRNLSDSHLTDSLATFNNSSMTQTLSCKQCISILKITKCHYSTGWVSKNWSLMKVNTTSEWWPIPTNLVPNIESSLVPLYRPWNAMILF